MLSLPLDFEAQPLMSPMQVQRGGRGLRKVLGGEKGGGGCFEGRFAGRLRPACREQKFEEGQH